MRQVHLTAASFSALLDREPPKPLSGSPPVIPHATDGIANVGKLIELAKLISLNFAHRLEGWVITLCGNSSGLGDDHGTWHTFPSMLGTFTSASSKILVALDPVTPKRLVRVWEAHRPDTVISNPNIMEYRWHNPSEVAEQSKLLNELALALGIGATLHSMVSPPHSAARTPVAPSRASRSPSPSPPRGWGAMALSTILRDYRRHVFNVIETYADDKQSLLLLMEEALKPRGQSALIQEHALSAPYPLRWTTMTVSVRHCAEALLALQENGAIEPSSPHPCSSRPLSMVKRILSVEEYRSLVANLADSLRDVPSVLLTLLKEARSEGITPNLEAMMLLPPTNFSWELMMKIIEEEVLKIIGPSISISDVSLQSASQESPHLGNGFRQRFLEGLDQTPNVGSDPTAPLDATIKWFHLPAGPTIKTAMHPNLGPPSMGTTAIPWWPFQAKPLRKSHHLRASPLTST